MTARTKSPKALSGSSSSEAVEPPFLAPGVPRFHGVNWRGVWTLYLKEVRRFWKVAFQTIAAPIATTLLFLLIFSFALGNLRPSINGVPFAQFLAPGLVMMAVLQNAFANTSSAILIAKIQGNIVDYLMPPLSPGEINAAMALSGMTRGAVVGLAAGGAMALFVDMQITHIFFILFHALGGALLLSLLGMITGIWAEKFDHLASVSNFIIVPLSFLSGTFYAVSQLPESAWYISQFNPFFYLIDGMRYGFTGYHESHLLTGLCLIAGLNLALWLLCDLLLRYGWRLKT